MTLFTKPITPNDVAQLVDFTVADNPDTKSMAEMQKEGVAALYNILCEGSVAYLADEVGMGKTYQALALAALTWNEKPNARIVFITPRQNLQEKWVDDYRRFFASNYRRHQKMGDDRVTSILFGEPIHRPEPFKNLRSWTPTIGMPERIAPFLRHTSFTRPVFLRSADLTKDVNQLWYDWRERFISWTLFDSRRPSNLTSESASRTLNLAFAKALNKKLAAEALHEEAYFDLAIVDEAQCLRHPGNQTNTVLAEALKNQVAKWLFMSATPAHGGPADISTIINSYPNRGEILDPNLANHLPNLQNALEKFMVRRQRRYRAKNREDTVSKEEYRDHDQERWSVQDKDMTALSTLAMGLVQKGLVDVLASRNNRYRIGFLSSFESLQSSIRSVDTTIRGEESRPDGEQRSDQYYDPSSPPISSAERDAPDAEFVNELASDFKKQFDIELPHAKVDSVVERIAPFAFGSDNQIGGHKFLIFTRRISTVYALRDSLLNKHREAVEARMSRYWKVQNFNWSRPIAQQDDSDDDVADSEAFDSESDDDPFRVAMSKGGWLHRYRQTFRSSGRNSLFFEDGWLNRLCIAGGVDPHIAAEQMPDEIWAESWQHASSSGSQHFAERLRYLAVQGIKRVPEIFGLKTEVDAKPWRIAYEACLPNCLTKIKLNPDAEPRRDHQLFSWPTLWTMWDGTFGNTDLALPADKSECVHGEFGRDELCRRQVARTILSQTFRLSDTLLDLYYADESGGRLSENLGERFLAWIESDDPGAMQVKNDCRQWLSQLRLIVDGCLDGAGLPWHELANKKEESWQQLYQATPVVGVTGGSGGNNRAIRQFRTPSMPRVIVCTDTLKEGVDLHLFCDNVLHYGVAWTAGDMEQRVGRVDRYFSKIERRLAEDGPPPNVKLHVGYPHVVSSLERNQVERVIARQKAVEALLDSPLAGTSDEAQEFDAGSAPSHSVRNPIARPFSKLEFPDHDRIIEAVSIEDATNQLDHYQNWYSLVEDKLQEKSWRIEGDGSMADGLRLSRRATLVLADRQHSIEWAFDAGLRRYVITLTSPPWPSEFQFDGGKRRHIVGKDLEIQSFVRLLAPSPDEGKDESAISSLIDTLSGRTPSANIDAKEEWDEALVSLASDGVDWQSDHKAVLNIPRGNRSQRLTVYAYEGSIRAVSVVAASLDALSDRDVWNGNPSHHEIEDWILDTNNELPLGYFDLSERDGLVFGIHVLHGNLSSSSRRRLLEEVGWRADAWEASLTGADLE